MLVKGWDMWDTDLGTALTLPPLARPSGFSGGWSPCPSASSSLSMMRSGNLEFAVAQGVSVEPRGLGGRTEWFLEQPFDP